LDLLSTFVPADTGLSFDPEMQRPQPALDPTDWTVLQPIYYSGRFSRLASCESDNEHFLWPHHGLSPALFPGSEQGLYRISAVSPLCLSCWDLVPVEMEAEWSEGHGHVADSTAVRLLARLAIPERESGAKG